MIYVFLGGARRWYRKRRAYVVAVLRPLDGLHSGVSRFVMTPKKKVPRNDICDLLHMVPVYSVGTDVVGGTGLEPVTSSMSTTRSSQLS
jgi:tetraacyldisaccharide-1-P 4'-kinase